MASVATRALHGAEVSSDRTLRVHAECRTPQSLNRQGAGRRIRSLPLAVWIRHPMRKLQHAFHLRGQSAIVSKQTKAPYI